MSHRQSLSQILSDTKGENGTTEKLQVFSVKGTGTLFMSSHKSPLSLQMALHPKTEAVLVKEPDLEQENPQGLVRPPLKGPFGELGLLLVFAVLIIISIHFSSWFPVGTALKTKAI